MNLVIQAPSLDRSQADELAGMCRASSVEVVAAGAFRLRRAAFLPAVETWCEERHIDCARVPEGRRFKDLELLAMDMDSTLIAIECIDELGDMAGRKPEIAAITELAMRGEIDYAESLRRRVQLLAGLEEKALTRVYEERLALTAGAEQLISACKEHGVKLLLVSGGFSYFTERLKSRLGLDFTLSNSLAIENGVLTGRLVGDVVDAGAKAATFLSLMKELRATRQQTVAVGDGANDLKMMAQAGVSVAFRAKPVVRAQASYALNWSGLDGVRNLFE